MKLFTSVRLNHGSTLDVLRQPLSPLEDHLRTLVFDRCNQLQVIMVGKHVKGHSGGRDARSWVNGQCDTRAGREMRVSRALLGGRV
jgi:hypothetical protein